MEKPIPEPISIVRSTGMPRGKDLSEVTLEAFANLSAVTVNATGVPEIGSATFATWN